MADIELVIKIDEEQYEFIKQSMTMDEVKNYHALLYDICKHIKSGTPLPKGHGDLIDADDIKVIELEDSLHIIRHEKGDEIDVYIDAPTIIEADKEEREDRGMKEILDVIHKTIYQFFDGCGDDEEVPMSDKDKLLLEVNKAICNNLKALEKENKIIDEHYKKGFASGLRTAEWRYDNAIKEIRECLGSLKGSMFSDGLRYALEIISKYRDTNSREAGKIMDKEALMPIGDYANDLYEAKIEESHNDSFEME